MNGGLDASAREDAIKSVEMPPTIKNNPVIDHWEYLKSDPGLVKYVKANRHLFDNRIFPILFHYWFVFEGKREEAVKLIPSDQLLPIQAINKYTTPEFKDLLCRIIKGYMINKTGKEDYEITEDVVVTENIIRKFILDYEISAIVLKAVCALPMHFVFQRIQKISAENCITGNLSNMQEKKIRMLIMDCLFPVVHGHWRTVEINHFLNHPLFDVDIFVHPYAQLIDQITGIDLVDSFRYYHRHYPHLKDHNIIIFDPKFNKLNVMNRRIDGTKFNRHVHGHFLLTKKDHYDFRDYDIGYCIFLGVRNANAGIIKKRWWPSVCKIYPGGGYGYDKDRMNKHLIEMRDNGERAIATQAFITEHVNRFVQTLNVYGVPLVPPSSTFTNKVHNSRSNLNVCFTSLGFALKKGYEDYMSLVDLFAKRHRSSNIKFHIVGLKNVTSPLPNVVYHSVMAPQNLLEFYRTTIDVIASLPKIVNNCDPDGFPLGGEAMIQGCIPVLCDPYNCNSHFGFNENEALVMRKFDIAKIENFILNLYRDPAKRQLMSKNVAEKSRRLFGPEMQLLPVERFLLQIARDKKAIKQ